MVAGNSISCPSFLVPVGQHPSPNITVPLPVLDLVKLSGFARSFEPLIYYFEIVVQQIGTLPVRDVDRP